ncbi:MAG: sugar phosphate isomerase/epimerase [Clostridiaceae bacterium]|nr:sugar phosphate isomerase/epimerase [Clostridiaceae bacterium]
MNIGIVSRSFTGMTTAEAAETMKLHGFKCTELCFSQADCKYWVYNGTSDISDLTNQRVLKIVETYGSNGIEVVSIGVFTNLVEPDEDTRRKNLDYFVRHMEYANYCGVKFVVTECGFRKDSRGILADRYESDFSRMLDSVKYLAEKADRYDVFVAIEPCVLDVIPSAKRMKDFISQCGSGRVKVLLDPANLIANSSEEDMFKYLKDNIAYFHGKDRKVNDAYGRVLGEGDIDWLRFFSLYKQYSEGVPFILEYVNEKNCGEIRQKAMDFYSRA